MTDDNLVVLAAIRETRRLEALRRAISSGHPSTLFAAAGNPLPAAAGGEGAAAPSHRNRRRGDGTWQEPCPVDWRKPLHFPRLVEQATALAAAGLLATDADRAVLDAADALERARIEHGVRSVEASAALHALLAAVRVRRETQP